MIWKKWKGIFLLFFVEKKGLTEKRNFLFFVETKKTENRGKKGNNVQSRKENIHFTSLKRKLTKGKEAQKKEKFFEMKQIVKYKFFLYPKWKLISLPWGFRKKKEFSIHSNIAPFALLLRFYFWRNESKNGFFIVFCCVHVFVLVLFLVFIINSIFHKNEKKSH